ncbi:Signal transduction histidine-protein kinase BarA [Marinobacter litoralis]|uniref:histidine kinase n=1 Tax=Marinobacter litoralis TaxID=187981 RepID=A0A3M2RLZ3_9GAMM|nr:histidine kinase dimerization/phospho-acceptor domain-containing protein [Marinobacter litoralis]RMJ06370.1 Signal transduction histidine-protein kinase BarA [Marinobacter litoralis]
MIKPRKRTVSLSLSRRLLLLGLLPAVLMFTVLVAFFTSVRMDDARSSMAQSSQLLADNLAPVLEYAIVSGNSFALEQVLDNALEHSDAHWVRVIDVVGEEIGFASAEEQSIDITAPQYQVFESEIFQEPLMLEENDGGKWFQSGWESGAGILRIGSVQVAVRTEALDLKLQNIWWSSLAVGGGTLLFAIVLVQLFLGNILRSMQNLGSRVGSLIRGNYRLEPINTKGVAGEIVDLQHQLNELAERLQDLKTTRDETLSVSESERAKAEHANRVKSEFLASMRQELNTPLTGVIGMIKHIEQEELSPQQKDYLTTAKKSLQDLLTVISNMLDYAHLDTEAKALDAKPFDLRELISNCVASYRHAAELQELSLESLYLGDWPEPATVIGDAPRVRQVLSGLLDNSLEMTSNGFITVRTTWVSIDEQHVLMSCTLRDSSSSTHNANTIHNPHTHSRFGGPGFNLAMVQRLVELMGGHVQIELDMGQGTSLRFEIPFDLPATEQASA